MNFCALSPCSPARLNSQDVNFFQILYIYLSFIILTASNFLKYPDFMKRFFYCKFLLKLILNFFMILQWFLYNTSSNLKNGGMYDYFRVVYVPTCSTYLQPVHVNWLGDFDQSSNCSTTNELNMHFAPTSLLLYTLL